MKLLSVGLPGHEKSSVTSLAQAQRSTPPARWYQFSPDRKRQHSMDHLSGYQGWMHADGYAGFEELYRSGEIREVACMAHVRRKFVDVHRAQGSAIADEAIGRIA